MTPDVPTMRLVSAQIEARLQAAGIAGVFPTPLDELASHVGIDGTLDIEEFNSFQRQRRSGVIRRFTGALIRSERVILVDHRAPGVAQRWIRAHEIAHQIFEWHQDHSYLDHDETLTLEARELVEQEANLGAEYALFQGDRFFDRALSYRTGVGVAVKLAYDFDASITATLRYYVRHHLVEIAVVVVGRYVQGGRSRISYSESSASFTRRFGDPLRWFPGRKIPVNTGQEPEWLAGAVRQARQVRGEIVHLRVQYGDLNGDQVEMEVEVFDNSYSTFIVMTPHRRIALGRRVVLDGSQGPADLK